MRTLKLSPEEGFVLSRIDGPTSLSELSSLSGIDEGRLAEIITKLAQQGAVEVPGVAIAPPELVAPAPPAPSPPSAPALVPEPPPPSETAPTSTRGPVAKRPSLRLRASKAPAGGAPPPSQRLAAAKPAFASELPPLVQPPSSQRMPAAASQVAPPPSSRKPPALDPAVPMIVGIDELDALPLSEPEPEPPPPPSKRPSAIAASVPMIVGIDELDAIPPSDREPTIAEARAPSAAVSGVSLSVAGVCDVGRSRSNNEDALVVADLSGVGAVDVLAGREALGTGDGGVLLAVSDGMGGENAGEVASAIVVETLTSHLAAHASSDDPAGALASAVHEANARVIAAADKRELAGMGATLVAVLVRRTTAFTAEVGDSRAYVLRRGELLQLSKDQTHVRFLVEQGLMTLEDVKRSRAKNIVLQACGKLPELVVAQRRLDLRLGDRLLLCSDGLTTHVEDDEIQVLLASGAPPEEASAKLVAMANERGGKDNITVLVADIGGTLPWPGANESIADTLVAIREFAPGEGDGGEA